MKKTRAEIQRAYRERKKANDDTFLQRERERRMSYYKGVETLPRRERLKRQLKTREAVARHRTKKRLERIDQDKSTDSPPPMVVKMPFTKIRTRRRISRAVAKNRREIQKVKEQLNSVTKRYRAAQRRLLRAKNREDSVPSTPRSRTLAQMQEANIDHDQAAKIRRQLLLGHVVMDEVKEAKKGTKKKKTRLMSNVIAGKIVKKYRCASLLSKNTGFDRRTLGKAYSKNLDKLGAVRQRDVRKFREEVIAFLERDDNSRAMPGKADKIKTAEGDVQQRVLTDYMSTLHQKFLAENASVTLSLSTFQRIRPKYLKTTAFVTRSSCLCTRHQNMALLMKALKREGVDAPANPEKFLTRETTIDQDTASIDEHDIMYEQWKRVTIEDKDKKKFVMRIVKITTKKMAFVEHLKQVTTEFQAHVDRMRNQYDEIRRLKNTLPAHHAVVHMDFAENYTCRTVDEIQSAYWNQTAVTLHPSVVYTQEGHKSFVIVSDDVSHNAASVVSFVIQLIAEIKKLDPLIERIHYWTDGPTSQYRNRSIFYLVSNHEDLFPGISAQWNYFEAGHGKGPCDGLGGSTKRLADQAMRNGKVTIQDAEEFYSWSQGPHCTMQNVKFLYISKDECEKSATDLAAWDPKGVPGTMKIHAIKGLGDSALLTRQVSCYCEGCVTGTAYCSGWVQVTTAPPPPPAGSSD